MGRMVCCTLDVCKLAQYATIGVGVMIMWPSYCLGVGVMIMWPSYCFVEFENMFSFLHFLGE